MGRTAAHNLALIDRIMAALDDGPGNTAQIAVRVGTVGCICSRPPALTPGVSCGGICDPVGWRPAYASDVRPLLARLERTGAVTGLRDPAMRHVTYSRVRAAVEVERG